MPPPAEPGPPDPYFLHRAMRRRGARHLQLEGGQGHRARGEAHCPAARSPLTADPNHRPEHSPPPPPRPAGTAWRQRGEQGTQARACARVRHRRVRGTRGKSAPPQSAAGSPGPEPPSQPPAAIGGCTLPSPGGQGSDSGEPPSPPTFFPPPPPPPSPWAARSWSERRRPRSPPEGRLHPGEGRHSRGERSRAPSAPGWLPAHSRIARCRPAALRRRRGPQQIGGRPGMRRRGSPP